MKTNRPAVTANTWKELNKLANSGKVHFSAVAYIIIACIKAPLLKWPQTSDATKHNTEIDKKLRR